MRSRAIYQLYGAEDKVQEFDYDVGHSDVVRFRKEAYAWINRWVKNDPTPYEEGQIQREEPATLTVLDRIPAGAVNEAVHRSFVKTHRVEAPKNLAQWEKRRAALLAQLRETVFRAFPQSKVPFEVARSPERGWASRYAEAFNLEFTTEEGVRVDGQLFVPRGGAEGALIYAKGAEDVVYPIDYHPRLSVLGRHVVLVLKPRAVDYPADNYRMATLERTAALIGATIESMQVWNILRAVDYLVEGEGLKLTSIAVYGRKQMGALALYAAALDQRITRVILEDPPATHWQGTPLLNVLRVTDLAEAAALVAPREIVSLTPLPEAWRPTTAVYALYRKKDALRAANSLGEAMKLWANR